MPHQLCHFHYLREAALHVYEADRHAKKELKKQVRGGRPIERALEAREAIAGPAAAPPPMEIGYSYVGDRTFGEDGAPVIASAGGAGAAASSTSVALAGGCFPT